MHKIIYRKSILVFWIILEVVFAATFVVMTIKKGEFVPHGFIIDENFLNNLVQYKIYLYMELMAMALFIFFASGLVFYAIGLRKTLRNTFVKKDRGILVGVIFLPLAGFAVFALPAAITFPDRLNNPPTVQKEQLAHKYETHSRSGTSYHFRFSSGKSDKVSKDEYFSISIGKQFYIVYQGETLIEAFPVDKFILRL